MDSQCRGGKNRESFIKYAERVPKKSGTRSFLEKEKNISWEPAHHTETTTAFLVGLFHEIVGTDTVPAFP